MKKHTGGLAKFLNDDTQNAARNLNGDGNRIVYIDIDDIVSNPRNFYGLRDIDSLAGLIAVSHMVEPLIVCPEEDGKYMLLSGHRRRAAVQKLLEDGDYEEWKLPCIIHERRKITIPQENGEEIVFDESDVDLLHLIASNRGQRKERTMDEKLSEVKYLEPFARAVFAQKRQEQGKGMVFRTVLKVGFFIFLIHSWVGTNSNYQLMPALSSGFETMGYTAGGAQDMITEYVKGNPDSNIEVQSNQIVTNALNFFNIFWESASQKNLLTILVDLVCVVAAVIILFLTALEMFMVRIEFWTMALITIPLLPFGVIDKLKFLSDKAIGTMFNLAIKIFVIAFLATMSVNILTGLVENAKAASTSADFMGNIPPPGHRDQGG